MIRAIDEAQDEPAAAASPTGQAETATPEAPDHWPSRVELAAVLRVAAAHGLHEGIDNHCSLAVGPDRFVVNPYGPHWTEARASELLLVDHDGSVTGSGVLDATAFHIHRSIHRARPDAVCVLHTHMPHATAIACGDDGFVTEVSQNSMRFTDRVAWLADYEGLAHDESEGDRIAAAVAGGARAVFLAHHGVIVMSESVAHAWHDLYFLERACMVQVLADSAGKLRTVAKKVARATAQQTECDRAVQAPALFAAELRLLERQNPGHAT